MASDWLAAVLPANQMSGLEIFVNWHGFEHGNFLVAQTPGSVTSHNNLVQILGPFAGPLWPMPRN